MTELKQILENVASSIVSFLNQWHISIGMLRIFVLLLLSLIMFLLILSHYNDIKDGMRNALGRINTNTLNRRATSFESRVIRYKQWGVLRKSPKMAQPLYCDTIHALMGMIGVLFILTMASVLNIQYLYYFSPIGFIIGWLFLDVMYKHRNKSDNENMQTDMKTIYNILSTQVKGGAYISDAFIECGSIIRNTRLKDALWDYRRNVLIENRPVPEAIDEFESNFDNIAISSLCMTLKQTEETGRSLDIIRDLAKQLIDLEEVEIEQKKMKIERAMSFAIIILFADIMGFVFYVLIKEMLSQATFL